MAGTGFGPAGAQGWVVQASTGWLNFGPLVREAESHVRLGNMGSDIYFGLTVERSLGGRTAAYASVLAAPTSVMVWPRLAGDRRLDRFSFRPFAGAAELVAERDRYNAARVQTGPVSWTCASAGVARRLGPVRGGGGLVACGLSELDPELWGRSGLRVAPGLEMELSGRLPVTSLLHLGTSCNGTVLLLHRGFVRMREGEVATSGAVTSTAVELPRLEPRRFALPLRCGVAAGVSL